MISQEKRVVHESIGVRQGTRSPVFFLLVQFTQIVLYSLPSQYFYQFDERGMKRQIFIFICPNHLETGSDSMDNYKESNRPGARCLFENISRAANIFLEPPNLALLYSPV